MFFVGNDGDELIECAPGRIDSGLVAAFGFLLRNICTSETIIKD